MVTNAALQLLDAVETIEMRSLTWGYADGSLSQGELMDLGPPSALDELTNAQLLIEIPGSSGATRYRSRFAEMVRLLFRSRQLFPGKPWIGAPRLVSDFRIDRRPRRYPKRYTAPADIATRHADTISAKPLHREVWQALTSEIPGLAAFQERATARLLCAPSDSGTIVTAGTGSGKTMAFYLPALMRIAEAVDDSYWTKAIAIYPRTELLKDQFAEAYRMARRLDVTLARQGKRKITVGAFFGSTPNSVQKPFFSDDWRETRAGRICPWLRCPSCDAELAWRKKDLIDGVERLSCLQPSCNKVIGPDEIVLTRHSLNNRPPDILFTTTEMLNQRLSDHWYRGLLGVGVPDHRKPFIALLDEVHTYSGTSGAQAALVLRRWRHAVDAPIIWAGLSATLAEARRFFAELTGVREDRVEEVSPEPFEMETEGAEYQIILQGDPGSRASLLSTSIQAAMLIARTLDPTESGYSSGAFGQRLFVFTDDLDVTNRLFDDLRDAESYDLFGRPDATRRPLAALRAGGPDGAVRDRDGQRWRMCEQVGHDLHIPLVVGRTTSQDSGVNAKANVIVATAALEVGFNDPHVGAVLQHKAPRNAASFLQRKGRAGRNRAMRPITVTVLSDYGRDRLCFQTYEHLFDPQLPPQQLPIGNRYVLKMQAVFAFFDWLSVRAAQMTPYKGTMWRMLSGPKPFGEAQALAEATKTIIDRLMIYDSVLIAQLRQHLKRALRVDDATVDGLLWDPPRALMLEALPTLNRRVTRAWRLAFPKGETGLDLCVPNHPLPDFVPRALFSDLNLPEVTVVIPPATTQHEIRRESLPIVQALGQLVPGRVTRRFAHERGQLCHWVPVASLEPLQVIRIDDYAQEHEFIGSFTPRCNEPSDSNPLQVFRPWTVELRQARRNDALPSSNARLNWDSEFIGHGEPLVVPPPPRSRWSEWIGATAFHVHRYSGSVTVRRFASSAGANIRRVDADYPVRIEFETSTGDAAALGFAMDVDGMRLDLSLPRVDELAALSLPADLAASARSAYLRSSFLGDPDLPSDLNVFQRDWLIQIAMSVVLSKAVKGGCSAAKAAADVFAEERIVPAFQAGMADLFGTGLPPRDDEDESEEDDEEPTIRMGRLEAALTAQIARTEVQERLRALAPEFDLPNRSSFGTWLRNSIAETLGEALLQACLATAPRQATIDTLLLDFEPLETGAIRIWITEATLGGAGVLQAFAERFASEPRLLFSALEASLAQTDLEIVAVGIERVVSLATSDPAIDAAMRDVRAAVGHAERETAWAAFRAELARRGLPTGHSLSVSLNSRLMRVGSGPELDKLLDLLLRRWKEIEAEFGLAIGLREFASLAGQDDRLVGPLREFLLAQVPGAIGAQIERISLVSGLLWPRGAEIRQRALQSYNPFRRPRFTDPGLARAVLMSGLAPEVRVEDEDWRGAVARELAQHGTIRLSADKSASNQLQAGLIELAATPIDVAYLQFFATLERFEDVGERRAAILTLREQV
ncbi:DEAD/DEAH box helicase [Sinorhizobium meliloti]|nr:DEAD/DEAH box helicase [Sinorhizobium meliloti]MDW9746760.1 DEAD/DEAH box helicase [Sinorhizobium meliloti]